MGSIIFSSRSIKAVPIFVFIGGLLSAEILSESFSSKLSGGHRRVTGQHRITHWCQLYSRDYSKFRFQEKNSFFSHISVYLGFRWIHSNCFLPWTYHLSIQATTTAVSCDQLWSDVTMIIWSNAKFEPMKLSNLATNINTYSITCWQMSLSLCTTCFLVKIMHTRDTAKDL